VQIAEVIGGTVILLLVLIDTFETVILPRSVSRPFRLSRLLVDYAWRGLGRRIGSPQGREIWLGGFGPLAVVGLIVTWVGLLVVGFAMLQHGLETPLDGAERGTYGEYLYWSGTTLFTVGFGDMVAMDARGRAISVIEGGMGFGFLALVLAYLPVLYQSFSRREMTILLLDSRAGSPPAGAELLCRTGDDPYSLIDLLKEFERWSAGLLESYLSYPILAYYRSQHDKLSWLAALTAILDTCALIKLEFRDASPGHKALQRQAEHTYAMARHVIVDLAFILDAPPSQPPEDRLDPATYEKLHQRLEAFGIRIHSTGDSMRKLAIIRREYEPYLVGIGSHLLMPIVPIWHEGKQLDSWQTSAWDDGEHFS
jgi:hypothetical protein